MAMLGLAKISKYFCIFLKFTGGKFTKKKFIAPIFSGIDVR